MSHILTITDRELLVILGGLKYLQNDLDGMRTREEATKARRIVRQNLLAGEAPPPDFIDHLCEKLILGSLDTLPPPRPQVLIIVSNREVTYKQRGDVEVRLVDYDLDPGAKLPRSWTW
jgi:hypothetical protein